MKKNTVTQEQINSILENSKWEWEKTFGKTLVGMCQLPNGFVIVEASSCVDEANFDWEIGEKIIRDRIENKVWELEGYKLQDSLA